MSAQGSNARPKVFLREATGLVREISWLSVFIYVMTVMGFQFTFYYIASLAPIVGGNLAFGFLIYSLASVISILVYYTFTTIMPRSGGDYVFISRTLNPLIGFVGNISLGIILLLFAAINGVTIETTALSTLFAYIGTIYKNQTLIGIASSISQPMWIIILGLIWIIGSSFFALRSTRFYLKAQNYMFIVVMIGAVSMLLALALVSHSGFINAFNSFVDKYKGQPSDYYSNVISTATSDGWSIPSFSIFAGLLIYPLLAVGAIWGGTSAQVSGEIRNPRRSYLTGTLLGSFLYIILTAITLLLTYHTIGFKFLSAIDYLLYNNPSQVPLPALPYVDLLIAVATNPILATIIILAGFVQLIIYIPSAYIFMSRGLFAYSFDGVLPKIFGQVSDRTHGPVYAVIASTLITVLLFAIINIPASATYAYLFGSVATWWTAIFPTFFVGLSAVLLPILKPDLHKVAPIKAPLLTVLGLCMMAFMTLLVYLMLTNSVYGANTPIGIELMIGLFVVLIVVYLASWIRKRALLKLAFQEIPPE